MKFVLASLLFKKIIAVNEMRKRDSMIKRNSFENEEAFKEEESLSRKIIRTP